MDPRVLRINWNSISSASNMPLTKQYLRYVHQASFGVVSGRKSNAILLAGKGGGQLRIIAPAVEDIIIWDPRKGEKVSWSKLLGI